MYLNKLLIVLGLLATTCSKDVPTSPAIKPQTGGQTSGDTESGTTGETLTAWKEGYLDIHYINSGRGECSFIIYPDGTQLLLDCGASIMKYDSSTNLDLPQVGIYPKPNGDLVAGHWYMKYIQKCMAWTGNNTIDYGLSTHFDGDHLGVGYSGYGVTPPKPSYGSWFETGFTYLLDSLKFGTMIDRGYPDYSYPYAQSGTVKSNCDNFRSCADYHQAKGELKRAKFVAGSNSQLAMTHNAASYPTFKVQNVYVNGEVWTGNGTATRQLFPDQSQMSGTGGSKECSPSENSCSCAIKISYGNFDYYSGGDAGFNGASTYDWKHVEKAIQAVVGPVEVMKATHHGSADGCSQELLDGLNPNDIVINVWQAVQPRAVTYERMLGTSARLYATNINPTYELQYSDKGARFASTSGHIVVRVLPEGTSYYIYTLDDTDVNMGMKITKTFGPYKCK